VVDICLIRLEIRGRIQLLVHVHGVSASTSADRAIMSTCLSHCSSSAVGVAKMTSHAIFQYNVLAIDDTHNT